MASPNYVTQTSILRRVASNPSCRFKWTSHALEQMIKRKIHEEDVISALTNGQVILEEYKQDVVWRVEGKDVDGARLQVVAAVYEDTVVIKVVSAF